MKKKDAAKRRSADDIVAWLKRTGTQRVRDSMARYNIPSDKAFGVSVGQLQKHSRQFAPDHELALALWDTGWYEARMMAPSIDDAAQVTSAQMERWCKDFDNWAVVDTACFRLFDRTPHAWKKVTHWAGRRAEFEKRAAFALLWSLTVHDRAAQDAQFIEGLRLIEREAHDQRHFVMKAINMALRAVGKRNRALHAAAVEVSQRLSEASDAAARWVGKNALAELRGASVTRRLASPKRKPY